MKVCPWCGNADQSLIDATVIVVDTDTSAVIEKEWHCDNCSKDFNIKDIQDGQKTH